MQWRSGSVRADIITKTHPLRAGWPIGCCCSWWLLIQPLNPSVRGQTASVSCWVSFHITSFLVCPSVRLSVVRPGTIIGRREQVLLRRRGDVQVPSARSTARPLGARPAQSCIEEEQDFHHLGFWKQFLGSRCLSVYKEGKL